MVAAEFAAFRQRWAITRADVSDAKAAPDTILAFPPAADGDQPVTVGEFAASDLKNYLEAIDHVANSLAAITRTPRHYFQNAGANVSGDALLVAESGLTKKAERYVERLDFTWSELASFALSILGVEVDPFDVKPAWAEAATVQPLASAQTVETLVKATVPLKTALRSVGWADDDLEQLDEDASEAKTSGASLGVAMLEAAKKNLDAGGAMTFGAAPAPAAPVAVPPGATPPTE